MPSDLAGDEGHGLPDAALRPRRAPTRKQPARRSARSAPPVASPHSPTDSPLNLIADTLEYQPAFFPFQLSDEMYARILRDPAAHDYPTLPAGVAKNPKFGHIFVELREPGARRPKLVDGFDWVPSSTANASTRTLRDGETELLRYYCARRTKDEDAKPALKAFVLWQRDIQDDVKADHPGEDTYAMKRRLGEMWRALDDEQKQPYVDQAKAHNKQSRQRMASADPAQLLVRHEMCLREKGVEATGTRVLIHYLGDDAFQLLAHPPRPVRVFRPGPSKGGGSSTDQQDGALGEGDGSPMSSQLSDAYTLSSAVETSALRFFIGYEHAGAQVGRAQRAAARPSIMPAIDDGIASFVDDREGGVRPGAVSHDALEGPRRLGPTALTCTRTDDGGPLPAGPPVLGQHSTPLPAHTPPHPLQERNPDSTHAAHTLAGMQTRTQATPLEAYLKMPTSRPSMDGLGDLFGGDAADCGEDGIAGLPLPSPALFGHQAPRTTSQLTRETPHPLPTSMPPPTRPPMPPPGFTWKRPSVSGSFSGPFKRAETGDADDRSVLTNREMMDLSPVMQLLAPASVSPLSEVSPLAEDALEATITAIDEAARRSAAARAEEGMEVARLAHAMSKAADSAHADAVTRALEQVSTPKMTTAPGEMAKDAGLRSRDSRGGADDEHTRGEDDADLEASKSDWFTLFNVPQPTFTYP